MAQDSLIFLPHGGGGEFAAFAEMVRAAGPVLTPSLILPIQHTHVEWSNVDATHIGLEALSARGHFLPLALLPLQPFMDQPDLSQGFRCHALFRLSWYGLR
jgi:hypothetical protein